MYPIDNWWDSAFDGVTNADLQSYVDDYGLTQETPSDPKLTADVTAVKAAADSNGATGVSKVLDFILKYGDKALSILSKNGIIKNANLTAGGYSFNMSDVATNNAPTATSSLFGIDFTNPKTLIITFLLIMILAYFLFFKPAKSNVKR